MEQFARLAAKHFGILLIYVIFFRLLLNVNGLTGISMFGSASLILFHSIFLLVKRPSGEVEKGERNARILTGICILLIGMPTCFFIFISGMFK
jgi:hypothetical protein